MIINSIRVENFQSYFGSQTLDFSKGLNLIIGNGGKGKSKLFNAFYWVLFGKIYVTDVGWCRTRTLPKSSNFTMKKHGFINQKALFEADVNNVVVTSVMLEFEDDYGMVYQIDRSVSLCRISNGYFDDDTTWNIQGEHLKVSYETKLGTECRTDDMAELKISELFPEEIRNYIWFQGETLDSLINFRNKQTLKDAVKHISYYPFYEKLSEIVSAAKSKIVRLENKKLTEANKMNERVQNLLSTIDSINRKIEREEDNNKEKRSRVSAIELALAEGETQMSGLAGSSALIQKYDECDNKIKEINIRLTQIDNYQRSQLPKLWILRGADQLISECKEIIEKHKEEEYAVPEKKYLDNPSRSKLEEILRDGKCYVCGSDVSESSAAYHYIKERLLLQEKYLQEMEEYTNNMQQSKRFNMFIGSIQDYPDALHISLSQIDKQWKNSEEEAEGLMGQRKKLNSKKKELDSEIERRKAQFGIDPVKQAQSHDIIQSKIRASRSNLESAKRELDASDRALVQYKMELSGAEKQLSEISDKESAVSRVPETEWKNISIFLETVCNQVKEKARKELLKKIEERANEFYVKFTEHDKGYKGYVKIEDDYSIEFDAGLNTSHEDRKKMSIINALLSLNQEAVGTYYPFISDAPTSSFDLKTSHKYLLGIKEIFNQSIIMTKDVDLNSPQYKDLLNQPNVSKIYLLESEFYGDNVDDPALYEVSSKVKKLK